MANDDYISYDDETVEEASSEEVVEETPSPANAGPEETVTAFNTGSPHYEDPYESPLTYDVKGSGAGTDGKRVWKSHADKVRLWNQGYF